MFRVNTLLYIFLFIISSFATEFYIVGLRGDYKLLTDFYVCDSDKNCYQDICDMLSYKQGCVSYVGIMMTNPCDELHTSEYMYPVLSGNDQHVRLLVFSIDYNSKIIINMPVATKTWMQSQTAICKAMSPPNATMVLLSGSCIV